MNIIKLENKYKNRCCFCHENIDLGDNFHWLPEKKIGFHINCPPVVTVDKVLQQQRKSINTIEVKTLDVESQVLPLLVDLFDGIFAVPFEYNQKIGYAVVKIKTRKTGKYIGSRIVSVHLGRHDGKEFLMAGYITKQGSYHYYQKFLNNPDSDLQGKRKEIAMSAIDLVLSGKENEAFALEYAKIARHCWRCGKKLYHPETLQNLEVKWGCGPICYEYVEGNDALRQRIENAKPPTIMKLT